MLSTDKIHVRVVDITRTPLPRANVVLKRLDGTGKASKLDFDKHSGLFTSEPMEAGLFRVEVSATNLQAQMRELRIPHAATPEMFILGKPNAIYYQRGTMKVPVEPRENLIAVTLTQEPRQKREEDSIRRLAEELGMKPVKVSEHITRNNVRVFACKPDMSTEARNRLIGLLAQADAVALAGPVLELHEETLSYLTDQLIVKCQPSVTREKADKIASDMGLRVVRSIPALGNGYLLSGKLRSDLSLLDAAQKLNALDEVIYAEPNLVETSNFFAITPPDFLVPQQWHIPLIGLPDAWETLRNANPPGTVIGGAGDQTFGSENITIAVYDSGIESATTGGVTTPRHPDFRGNVTSGAPKVTALFNFATMAPNNDGITNDHGMGCAGVAAARANNPSGVPGENEGVAGAAGNCPVIGLVAPFGFPNLRWSDSFLWMSGFDPGWVADGTSYPVGTVFPVPLARGIDVHTSSVRIPDVGLMDDTLDFLATFGRGGRGVISCVAAGNTPTNIAHPANNTIADHDKIITVAASINTDVRSSYSCFDPSIDVCAPSNGGAGQGAPGKVTTDLIGGGNLAGVTGGALNYRNNFGGTSSATPLTAGVAALMLSINPDLNWIQVREILRNTAVKIDAANTDPFGQWTTDPGTGNPVFSQWYGYGRVNANAAVIAARDYGSPCDAVIRDNLADTGAVPSTGWHANSPDIWTRTTDDPIPALAYNVAGPHENPRRGQDNFVYLRVRNTGTQATNEIYLRALICHFPGFEFRYPQEWQPSVMPGTPVPSPLVPGTYLIGEALADNLAPGTDTIVKIRWDQDLVPAENVVIGGITVNWHPCLLAEASPHDSGPAAGSHDVKRYNDLAHKNIAIDDPGSGFSAHGVIVGSSHPEGVRSLILDRSSMSADARILIAIDDESLMKRWIELLRAGHYSAVQDLPWRRKPKLELSSSVREAANEKLITLLDRSRLSMTLAGGRELILEGAPGTRLSLGDMIRSDPLPELSIENLNGRTVLVFGGEAASSLELPMPIRGGRYIALALAVDHEKGEDWGLLRSTQRLNSGEFSPGYEMRSAKSRN